MAFPSTYPSCTHFGYDLLLKTYFASCSEVGKNGDEEVNVCCHQVMFPRILFSLSIEKFIEMMQSLLVSFPGLRMMDAVGFGEACVSKPELFLVELEKNGYVPKHGWIRDEYYNHHSDVWTVCYEAIVVDDCLSERERCVPDLVCHVDSDDDLGCVPLDWSVNSDGE